MEGYIECHINTLVVHTISPLLLDILLIYDFLFLFPMCPTAVTNY